MIDLVRDPWLPADYLPLACAVALFMSCAPLFVAVFFILPGIRLLAKPNVSRIRFDRRGVSAVLLDTTKVKAAWSDLEAVRWVVPGPCLRFKTCSDLWLCWYRRRLVLLLRAAEERYVPEAVARRRRRKRYDWLIRLALAVVLGGSMYIVARPVDPPFLAVLGAVTVAFIPFVIGFEMQYRSRISRWFAKRARQRERRRQQADQKGQG
jgi:hypothetical protein